MQDYQFGFRAEEQTIRIEPAFEIVSSINQIHFYDTFSW